MNKQEFLAALQKKLTGIPQNDLEERITFYSEMIDDRIEEGQSEETAIAELGTIDHIAAQVMSEIPLSKLVKERVKPSRALRIWEIVLLVLGSPIWLSLLAALFAVILSLYAVIWSLILALWAAEFSIAACSFAGIFCFAVFAAQKHLATGAAMLGAGLVCAGLAIFGFYGCRWMTKAILAFSKQAVIWTKTCITKKEETK